MTPAAGWDGWRLARLLISVLLTAALAAGLFQFAATAKNLPLAGWQRTVLGGLLGLGLAIFAARSVFLLLHRGGSGRRR